MRLSSKDIEEEKKRNERRNENEEKETEKNCELGVSGSTSDFNIIVGGLEFNILVRRLETRNFVLQV